MLAFAWLPLAPVFAFQSTTPAAVQREDMVNKVLGMVGPTEPSNLTEKKRFHLYVVSTAGPVPLLGEAVGAAIGQWENTPEEWGQGWSAYGKRYGSNLAYNAVRQTSPTAPPSLFTKTTDILLRINTIFGRGRVTQSSAL